LLILSHLGLRKLEPAATIVDARQVGGLFLRGRKLAAAMVQELAPPSLLISLEDKHKTKVMRKKKAKKKWKQQRQVCSNARTTCTGS
jgi:hypothetical protein